MKNEGDRYALPPNTFSMEHKPDPDGPGIYFIFLKERNALGVFSPGPDRLLYIGKSESKIEARNHAEYEDSSPSTLRRSLGAILRSNSFPDHAVFPRKSKRSLSGKALKKAIQNYRFSDESEAFLSEWMIGHLTYDYDITAAGVEEIKAMERKYISQWNPVLNLTYCNHRLKVELQQLREQCRLEAGKKS